MSEGKKELPSKESMEAKDTDWFKSLSKKVSFTKDLFSTLKDAGLVVFVSALLINHDSVIGWLNSHGFEFRSLSPLPGVTLEAMNRGQQVIELAEEVKSSIPQEKLGQFENKTAALRDSLRSVETEVLATPEARRATDWAVVVSGHQTKESAQKEAEDHRRDSLNASVFKKRSAFRVLVAVGMDQSAQLILSRVREKSRDAYPVGLDRWCGIERKVELGITVCTTQ